MSWWVEVPDLPAMVPYYFPAGELLYSALLLVVL
jgi:hypothetical protein